MVFARKVWRLLVGIKDGLVLLFLLLFFMALSAILTARPNPSAVREGALLIKLDGSVVEEPANVDPVQALLASEAPLKEYRARDIVRALNAAATDRRIKAVVLDLSRFTGGGQVNLQEIGAAMDTVRAANKPVLTYGMAYLDDGVLLAAHASEAWLNPLGGAFVAGPGGNSLYYGRLLEKLKVNVHVFRVGTYKDAVEPFLRNDQSPESRAARQAVYGAIWADWQDDVRKARPKADLARVTRDPLGWIRSANGNAAEAARAAGLVDRLGDKTQFGARVAALVGKDSRSKRPGAFANTALSDFLASHPLKSPGKKIGVVTVAGEIVDGQAGPGTAGGDRIARLLDEAQQKNLAGLVVRVDSPGGSVTASEAIRTAIERHATRGIPVAVSMGNVAASGGYWVSTPAQRIFAEPGTITGSIGIFSVIPSFENALGSIGVTGDGVRTTPLSGQPDLIGGLTPEVEGILQANIESGYGRFLALVARSRGKPAAQIDPLAQGRVWDGGAARQVGLVDQFGGMNEALAWVAARAKLGEGEWHAEYLGTKAPDYASLIERWRRDDDETSDGADGLDVSAQVAANQRAVLGRALGDIQRLLSGRGAQALCLDCPAPAGRAASADPAPFTAVLLRLLGL